MVWVGYGCVALKPVRGYGRGGYGPAVTRHPTIPDPARLPRIQELVAFAYHYQRAFLFPPHRTPFAEHCGMLHGVDGVDANQLSRLLSGQVSARAAARARAESGARAESRAPAATIPVPPGCLPPPREALFRRQHSGWKGLRWNGTVLEIPVLGWGGLCLRNCDKRVKMPPLRRVRLTKGGGQAIFSLLESGDSGMILLLVQVALLVAWCGWRLFQFLWKIFK